MKINKAELGYLLRIARNMITPIGVEKIHDGNEAYNLGCVKKSTVDDWIKKYEEFMKRENI